MREGGEQVVVVTRAGHARRLARLALVIVVALVALVALGYLLDWAGHFTVSQLGPYAPVVDILLLALVAAVAGPWLLVRERARLRALVARMVAWLGASGLWRGFAARFLANRLAPSSAAGLGLTVTVLLAGALGWVFLELLFQVTSGSPLVATDRRVLNLVATLRTPQLDSIMYFLTFLGGAATVVAVAAVVGIVLLLAGRRQDAVLILAALGASALFIEIVKLLVARPRPPLEDARLVAGGFAFPSGHSAIAATLYGTVALLVIRGLRRQLLQVLVGVAAALLVLAIGVSRVELGVHYPTDVLAGWAAGALWVVLVLAVEDIWPPRAARPRSGGQRAAIDVAAVALSLAAVALLATLYTQIPPPPRLDAPSAQVVPADRLPATAAAQLPHFTEELFGRPQEPIQFVFVATRQDSESAFAVAGWTEAQPLTFGTLKTAVLAGVTEQPDPAAPVTPSFLSGGAERAGLQPLGRRVLRAAASYPPLEHGRRHERRRARLAGDGEL